MMCIFCGGGPCSIPLLWHPFSVCWGREAFWKLAMSCRRLPSPGAHRSPQSYRPTTLRKCCAARHHRSRVCSNMLPSSLRGLGSMMCRNFLSRRRVQLVAFHCWDSSISIARFPVMFEVLPALEAPSPARQTSCYGGRVGDVPMGVVLSS